MWKHRWLLAAALVVVMGFANCAQAEIKVYQTVMDGPSESPPNGSPGTGFCQVIYDSVQHTMRIEASFSGLSAVTTLAHIRSPTAVPGAGTVGVATKQPAPDGFPLNVTAGAHDATFDMLLASNYNAPYITANGGSPATAETALIAQMDQGRAYFNIHTQAFGGGEIRGFLALVPEPGSFALLLGAGLMMLRRQHA